MNEHCRHEFKLIEPYDVRIGAPCIQSLKEECIYCKKTIYWMYYDGRRI